ncbi:FG-GAP repeat protein [Streptomyces sp. NBC_01285]|uniref:FG-GAP repeat protein n=1 Tax=Streptomyces sp. NBC_01285 TaxID=2903813 RepID=UPI00224E41D6|nr:FG-GAP repeat protein [Streptomyces sp. NBC_01285]MCX4774365.1 integrin alpha [Streptomyces sp. NBC_01285]
MRTNRSAAVVAAAFLLMAGAGIAAPSAYAGTPGGTHANDRNTDFNGDGYEDVLTGASGGTVGGKKGAGYVTVQYGAKTGIGTYNPVVLSQNTAGVPGAAEAGDGFGSALATGDLDGDGYDDAIVGLPGEDIEPVTDAGGIVVLWGSPKGLSGADSDWLQADQLVVGARFGSALAAAHFSPGIPGDQLAVTDRDNLTLYQYDAAPQGRSAQLVPASRNRLTPGTPGRPIAPRAMTTGDYDGNGLADLVVAGVTTRKESGHGWSSLFLGDVQGLRYEGDLRGGPAVASGDINNDGYDDLVTGEPNSPDDGGAAVTGGVVGVYYGSAGDGPAGAEGPGTPPVWWTQDTPGIPGKAEAGDGWGSDLSVADVNGDGYADVAIGAPGEDIYDVADAGAVWVLRGSADGLTAADAASWDQNSGFVLGVAEKGDHWGGQVRLSDPDRNGRLGLLAAAPGEDGGNGVIWAFRANTSGVTIREGWTFDGGSLGGPAAGAAFGSAIDE